VTIIVKRKKTPQRQAGERQSQDARFENFLEWTDADYLRRKVCRIAGGQDARMAIKERAS
jgi:hypothetical protein